MKYQSGELRLTALSSTPQNLGRINKEEGLLKSSKFTVIILTSFSSYAIIYLNDNVLKIESELSAHL